jgi:1-aminocyclopropane-1-carboxylate deaminase/D-cysteine desulfhydrase-like pyridoxal-dependent ACC family enzyme
MPSPLERAERLEQALTREGCARVPRIFIKRDDLLSLGMGGNKIRNLEFHIGRALADGATDVVTAGRQQSNHCRLTAAACARAGLTAHLVVNGSPPEVEKGNLLLDRIFGAKVYFTASDERAWRAAWVDALVGAFALFQGHTVHVIPLGGSDVLGALGHVAAAGELAAQCEAIGTRPDALVMATATGGTQAGMLCGLRKLGFATRVRGFMVAKSVKELQDDVRQVVDGVAAEIGIASPAEDLALDESMLGGGYAVPTAAGGAAIEMLARTEGMLADPVYTGKGLAGLLAMVRAGEFGATETVVFVHTGGTPALFL